MSSEYFLNGVDLDQPGRWRVMQGTLLPAVAAPRLHSTEVPIRSGILDGAGDRVGTFKVTAHSWLRARIALTLIVTGRLS